MVTCEKRLAACQQTRDKAIRLKNQWKARALTAEARISLPGRKVWPASTERWRGLLAACFDEYALKTLGRRATGYELDFGLGIVQHESGGDHLAVCRVEWIGTPPPGYDGTAATRATGLCQHVPAYWPGRSQAALGRAGNLLDPVDQLRVMGWLVFHVKSKAPNFGHWPDAPNGAPGSASKVRAELAALYE